MSKDKKGEGPPAGKSSFFYDALQAVKNMRNLEEEPLPGRRPSHAFMAALRALWDLGKEGKKKE